MKLSIIPNIITCFRILIIIPFCYFLFEGQYLTAFYLFVIAGISDCADGFLARQFNWQSKFGALVDPMADKLLITCSYILLAYLGKLPYWLMGLVLLRDIVLCTGGLSWYLLFGKIELNPTLLSKTNTFVQLLLCIICLYELAFQSLPAKLIISLMAMTTCTTLLSFMDYVWVWSIKAYKRKHRESLMRS